MAVTVRRDLARLRGPRPQVVTQDPPRGPVEGDSQSVDQGRSAPKGVVVAIGAGQRASAKVLESLTDPTATRAARLSVTYLLSNPSHV